MYCWLDMQSQALEGAHEKKEHAVSNFIFANHHPYQLHLTQAFLVDHAPMRSGTLQYI